MTIASPEAASGPSLQKYRNAMAVRTVSGGAAINVLTVPGVSNEPFKEALQSSLAANGYLANSSPKFFVDAEIKNLNQPLIGLDLEVTASVNYTVSGATGTASYPISSKGGATFTDSPLGADRMRIANERAMQENIRMFLRALH